MDYRSAYSGPQIDTAIARIYSIPDLIPGCIRLTSDLDHPVQLDQEVYPGYFVTEYYTSSVTTPTNVRPLIFIVQAIQATGKLVQLISNTDGLFIRETNMGYDFNDVIWKTSSNYGFIPTVSSLPDPTDAAYPERAIVAVVDNPTAIPTIYIKIVETMDPLTYTWANIMPRGLPGGLAELDLSGKVPPGQLPAMDYDPAGSAAAVDTKLTTFINTKGAVNGLAELDAGGKVPALQLPSYVDDVIEYDNKLAFPATGETGKIYVDKTTNLAFRWTGSVYVEISPSIALGITSSTAHRGDHGKIAYDHSQITGNPHGTTAVGVGALPTAGGDMLGGINMNGHPISGIPYIRTGNQGTAFAILAGYYDDDRGETGTTIRVEDGIIRVGYAPTGGQMNPVRITGVDAPIYDDDVANRGYIASNTLMFIENTNGHWDRNATAPTGTAAIRYNGYLRATRVYGMYYSDSADYAEAYDITGEFAPGDLIMINPDGSFTRNLYKGNRKVLGIVSTDPASLIGFEGDNKVPIAMMGRVPVSVIGRVKPGDFLMGSEVPGAMQSVPIDDAPRGAIVAQALTGTASNGTTDVTQSIIAVITRL